VFVARFPSSASFPCVIARSASTSLFSGPAQRSLALRPAHSRSRLPTLSIEGFKWIVAYHLPRLLPAGAILAGRDFHPLKDCAFPRHTITPSANWTESESRNRLLLRISYLVRFTFQRIGG
jgi:hypothetical protein